MQSLARAVMAALLSGLAAQVAQAAPVTVGTADLAGCYPFMCNDSGSNSGSSIHYQQVYAAGAFSGPITIASETFYRDFAQQFGGSGTLLGGTYVFSLSTTSQPVIPLSSTLSDNNGPDNTQVLSITIPSGGVPFGTSRTFTNTTDFAYDPSSGNLLLDIQVSNQDNVPTSNSSNDADGTGNNTSRAYAIGGINPANVDRIGLVTTFDTVSVPEPSSLLLLAGGLLGFAGVLRRKCSA
jgi:hypothetical protein